MEGVANWLAVLDRRRACWLGRLFARWFSPPPLLPPLEAPPLGPPRPPLKVLRLSWLRGEESFELAVPGGVWVEAGATVANADAIGVERRG